MATASVLTEQDDNQNEQNSFDNALAVTPSTVTYAVIRDLAKPDAAPGFAEYKEGSKLWKSTQASKNEKGEDIPPTKEVIFQVTITSPELHSLDGIGEVFGDNTEEAVRLLNVGMSQKLLQTYRAYYLETNEAGDFINMNDTAVSIEEATQTLAEPPQRRKQSPAQKAINVLKGMSEADRNEVLKALGFNI